MLFERLRCNQNLQSKLTPAQMFIHHHHIIKICINPNVEPETRAVFICRRIYCLYRLYGVCLFLVCFVNSISFLPTWFIKAEQSVCSLTYRCRKKCLWWTLTNADGFEIHRADLACQLLTRPRGCWWLCKGLEAAVLKSNERINQSSTQRKERTGRKMQHGWGRREKLGLHSPMRVGD